MTARDDESPLMPLAEFLTQEQSFYTSGVYLSQRELGIVKWAMLSALEAAQEKGWRFETWTG